MATKRNIRGEGGIERCRTRRPPAGPKGKPGATFSHPGKAPDRIRRRQINIRDPKARVVMVHIVKVDSHIVPSSSGLDPL